MTKKTMATVTGNATTQQPDDPLTDPRTRFPNDQPAQRQEWPGLQSRMTPKPDCGETNYRGSGRLGGLDILVSNAGYGWFLPDIPEHPDEKFDQTIKTNLYAPFWLSKAAIAVMKPGSAIVFTNSVTAFLPSDAFLDYSATKAALVAFTNALAHQVAKRGIRVNGVAPGTMWQSNVCTRN
jgi:NAD(P)-dependent dehydrogenase (short-subunit alcohol dehydrogenase family)